MSYLCENEVISQIKFVTENLDPKFWAKAFIALLLRVEKNSRERFFSIMQKIIETYTDHYLPIDINGYYISKKHINFEELNPFHIDKNTTAYLPSPINKGYILWNNPKEIRQFIGVKEDDNNVENLINKIQGYVGVSKDEEEGEAPRTIGRKLVCAIPANHDCLVVPLIFYCVNDLLKENKINVDFEFTEWTEIPEKLESETLNICYCTEEMIDNSPQTKPKTYIFQKLKHNISKLKVLRYSDNLLMKEGFPVALNFQGNYSLDRKLPDSHISYSFSDGEIIQSLARTKLSSTNYEFNLLLALAFGAINEKISVIPSIQGFLWAQENGLTEVAFNKCKASYRFGAFQKADIENHGDEELTKKPFGFCVLNQRGNNAEERRANTRAAKDLNSAILKFLEEIEIKMLSLLDKNPILAHQLAEILISPMLSICSEYNGIILRLSPNLLLNSGLSKGMFFEEYDDEVYSPHWWSELKKKFPNNEEESSSGRNSQAQ
ncbi:MAG: hypothetical protein U5L07_08565 [Desulfobacterales bacterium]|nr:hypothetical protein [Desulfobacterales bacterium]